MVEKEHLEAFTTAVDALSNNIGPLNTKTCEGVFAKARPLKGTDAELIARKAMVARLMRALKRLSKGSKEAAEARHEFCVKLWEAQPDKLKNAITKSGACLAYDSCEGANLTTWFRCVNTQTTTDLAELKAMCSQDDPFPVTCESSPPPPHRHPHSSTQPPPLRAAATAIPTRSSHVFRFRAVSTGHAIVAREGVDGARPETLSATIALGISLESVLGLPLPARQIEGQFVHDLEEEVKVGSGKNKGNLVAPSALSRSACYENGFDNTLRGQSVWVALEGDKGRGELVSYLSKHGGRLSPFSQGTLDDLGIDLDLTVDTNPTDGMGIFEVYVHGYMTLVIMRPSIGSFAMIKTKEGLREVTAMLSVAYKQMLVLGRLMGIEVPKYRTTTCPLIKMWTTQEGAAAFTAMLHERQILAPEVTFERPCDIGGETVRAAHKTTEDKRSATQQQIVDACAEGSAEGGETVRVAHETPEDERSATQQQIVDACAEGRETAYVAPAYAHAPTLDLNTMALPKKDGGVPYAGPASVWRAKGETVRVAHETPEDERSATQQQIVDACAEGRETVYVAPAYAHAQTLDLNTMALPKKDGGVPYAGPASVWEAKGETVYVAPAYAHAQTLDLKTMALPKKDGGVPYAGPASVMEAKSKEGGKQGAKATNAAKSAAAAVLAADRAERGVEPKRSAGNKEERAAYQAASNAAHKKQAEAAAASLFAPLLSSVSARSKEGTNLLAAIKEELEDPPGKKVYTTYEMMRHFLMAQKKSGGSNLPDTRAKFVSLLKDQYGVSIDRKRPDGPSDDASAPKPKKQKKR